MNVTKWDITLLVVMTMSIILMSFTMPAAGLAGSSNKTQQSDVPDFDINSDRFDFAGEFPERPGDNSRGSLRYYQHRTSAGSFDVPGISQKYIGRPTREAGTMFLSNATFVEGTSAPSALRLTFGNNSGGVLQNKEEYYIKNDSQEFLYSNSNNDWVVEFDVDSVENLNESNMTAKVDFAVKQTGVTEGGSSGGGLSALPVIGTFIEAGNDVLSGLIFAGRVVLWGLTFVFEISVNLLGMLLDAMVFGIDLLGYTTGTYDDVIKQSSGWASVVLTIPAIIMFVELLKLTMVGIKLLPTT